jgi:F0F1-type ATP synthase assembly protein I
LCGFWAGDKLFPNRAGRAANSEAQDAVNQNIDDRSPVAKALSKVSQITAISLMMIIPALIGYFVDQYFGTVILFTALGLVLGVGSAVWQLIQFVAHQDDSASGEREKGG